MHARVVLGVGKGVLFREVSSVQECPYRERERERERGVPLYMYIHVVPYVCQGLSGLLRLWFHECCRIFQDRLVNTEDRMWFDQKLRDKMADFSVKDSDVLGEGPLLYGDFMVPNSDNKIYEEIVDQQKVQ